jgi:hypothetical protein
MVRLAARGLEAEASPIRKGGRCSFPGFPIPQFPQKFGFQNVFENSRLFQYSGCCLATSTSMRTLDSTIKVSDTQSKLTDDKKDALAGLLAEMLRRQMGATTHFAPVQPEEITRIEIVEGKVNRKAIGYIYGFIDAALRTHGEDMADLSVGVPIVFHVLRRLFPGHEQAYTEFLANHVNDDVAVVLGMMAGGQQYLDFVAKPGSKGAPMGFARSIIDDAEF